MSPHEMLWAWEVVQQEYWVLWQVNIECFVLLETHIEPARKDMEEFDLWLAS